VENCGKLRACSACAGDYEDPERTAWAPEDVGDGEREEDLRTAEEEFLAEQ